MAIAVKSPGVYVEEIKKLPASIAQVETAIPAFIGYTEKASGTDPVRVTSMLEYEELFGGPPKENISIDVDTKNIITGATLTPRPYRMYQSLEMFYANGGGACYIVSVGSYQADAKNDAISSEQLNNGLVALETEDEPTLIVFPDAGGLEQTNHGSLYASALAQCNKLQDRFTIVDTRTDDANAVKNLRTAIGTENLKYGASYYPWLVTSLSYKRGINYNNATISFNSPGSGSVLKGDLQTLLDSIKTPDPDPKSNEAKLAKILTDAFIKQIDVEIAKLRVVLPPSGAIAGVYATVDRTSGVWKAPANIGLNSVIGPTVKITNDIQDGMNVDTSGKSVNAIRSFFGKGTLVWGARTLDGNDNEWRYINVRRFFNMVEESVKKSTSWAVFEPNNANTWVRISGTIQNYLTGLWRLGALAGSKPNQAFYVNVGLGTTMTTQDILDGKMNIEIGMAVSRPAEFIILKFSHKLQEI